MVPQPDLMVVPRSARGAAITQPPLLAVEIISPSDSHLLAAGMTRREGKLLDYAANGLGDFLELDLTTQVPVATRYELRDGALVAVDTVAGPAVLRAERPFAYAFSPQSLIE